MGDFPARIGGIEIGRVLDSYLLGETAQHWFPDFDREAVRPHEHWLCPTHYNPETGHFPMPVHSWVFRVGNKTVLVDTCNGNGKNRPGITELHMLDTRYLQRLFALGVRPEEVDYVLCTHLHLDHVGWNTRLESGRWVPTFPNARYLMSRKEYEATQFIAKNPGSPAFLREVFDDSIWPVMAAGRVDLVDDFHELLDCILLRPAPGHSPGNVRIELRSRGQLGVFSGDILHSPMQVPFWRWSSIACWNKEMAAQSRRELLQFCAAERAVLLSGHFEAPHVGRIRAVGDEFAIDMGW